MSDSTAAPQDARARHVANVEQSARIISRAMGALKPKTAVILGSGLGGLAAKVKDAVRVSYKDLPGFPEITVQGHAGEIVIGRLNGADVLMFRGRKHFYETDDAYPLKTMIRAVRKAGVETLFLSNAAGSLRPHIGVASLMLIADHINYMGLNPLAGPNDEDFGPRFFAMADAWDPGLREKIKGAARKLGIALNEGVYMSYLGPSFETPAEIRMSQGLGADAVGMSSVPDCLIARHCGMKVAGVSCITNMGAGLSAENLSHAHTLENAGKGAADFERLVAEALPLL
jgi:xanthosine phosphorylase